MAYAVPVRVACGWCGVEFETRHSLRQFCSRDHKKAAYKVRRRGIEAGVAGTYSWADVVRLWEKFDRRCAYCREDLPLAGLQAEHVVPLSRGGLNAVCNLLPSCLLCNGTKRDLGLREWAAWRTAKNLPPVVVEWDPEDARYSHLALDTEDMALIAA